MANRKAVLPILSRYTEGRKRHFITYFKGAEMYGIPYYSFVRLDEEATLYSIGLNTFRDIARDAGAIYRVKRIVLVNTQLIDEFLETFRDEDFESFWMVVMDTGTAFPIRRTLPVMLRCCGSR